MAASRSKGRGSKELARRKEALERAAARMASVRKEAEEAEAERLRREADLDELVADFELARQDEESVAAEVEQELARVRERGQARVQQTRVAAARVVVAMGEAGETVAGCAQRLGVGVDRVKELRRLGREAGGGPDGDGPGGRGAVKGAPGPQRDGAAAGGPGGEPVLASPGREVPAAPGAAAGRGPGGTVPAGPGGGPGSGGGWPGPGGPGGSSGVG